MQPFSVKVACCKLELATFLCTTLARPILMHIANKKTVHFDCAAYESIEEAKNAFIVFHRGDPDVIVFHRPKEQDWELIRRAYESGAEVIMTPFPDRYVAPSTR